MTFLDANIFLRYLTKDDPIKAKNCWKLFQDLASGDKTATTTEAIIAEIVYVLSAKAHYNLSHQEISARLRPLLAVRGLKIAHKKMYVRALDIYQTHNFLDFEDAISIAQMERQKINKIVSYDTDFDRVGDIKRQKP